MPTTRIALATTRRPKIEGAKAAFAALAAALDLDLSGVEWLARDAASGVEETPTRLEQLLRGARTRARGLSDTLSAEGRPARFAVGLEGGLWVADGAVFLQSWACVTDGAREAFGASGAIPVPAALADAVLRQGRSLGEVIDAFDGGHDVRSGQGAWGVLTRGLVTRERSFEAAVLNALAPFANRDVYDRRLG